MVEVYLLYILMFYPSGKYEVEHRPVEVKSCLPNADGSLIEDTNCGIRACLKMGRERAAEIWGVIPGMNFGLICRAPDGSAEAKEGTGAGGGHPALHFD